MQGSDHLARHLFLLSSKMKEKEHMCALRKKWIGEYSLVLNDELPHELAYLTKENHVDALIAERFVFENSTVLDLGANVGFCSLNYLKNGARKVVAFEPQSDLFRRLNEMDIPGLTVYPLAVSDIEGEYNLYLSDAHNQGHTLELEHVENHRQVFPMDLISEKVEVVALDRIFQTEKFDFVKIDVEGYELRALRGARKLLQRSDKCILQIEIYDRHLGEVLDELKTSFSHIYRVRFSDALGDLYLSTDFRVAPEDEFSDGPPIYICSKWSLGKYVLNSHNAQRKKKPTNVSWRRILREFFGSCSRLVRRVREIFRDAVGARVSVGKD